MSTNSLTIENPEKIGTNYTIISHIRYTKKSDTVSVDLFSNDAPGHEVKQLVTFYVF
jgi:hypothetical protein